MVAQACNPSYFGGRDQKDHGLRPAEQIVHETLPQPVARQNCMCISSQLQGLQSRPVWAQSKTLSQK
jgi:hypothetical protein